jgi:hypothetical protein
VSDTEPSAEQVTEPDPDETPQDAAKRRFREALDRKKTQGGQGHGAPGSTGSGIQASTAKTQRQFRRKSG